MKFKFTSKCAGLRFSDPAALLLPSDVNLIQVVILIRFIE